MRMTDLCEARMPADASARSRPGKLRPPSPNAPIRRKLRRESRCGRADAAVTPWWVGIGSPREVEEGGPGWLGAGARLRGDEVPKVVCPHFPSRSTVFVASE